MGWNEDHITRSGTRVVRIASTPGDRRDLTTVLGPGDETPAITGNGDGHGPGSGHGSSRAVIVIGADAASALFAGSGPRPTAENGVTEPEIRGRIPGRFVSGAMDAGEGADSGAAPSDPASASATGEDGPVTDAARLKTLTPRERDVALLVGHGLSVSEIAERLGRASTTVISHRRSLLRKLGCRDALGIARFTYRTGLVRP